MFLAPQRKLRGFFVVYLVHPTRPNLVYYTRPFWRLNYTVENLARQVQILDPKPRQTLKLSRIMLV